MGEKAARVLHSFLTRIMFVQNMICGLAATMWDVSLFDVEISYSPTMLCLFGLKYACSVCFGLRTEIGRCDIIISIGGLRPSSLYNLYLI